MTSRAALVVFVAVGAVLLAFPGIAVAQGEVTNRVATELECSTTNLATTGREWIAGEFTEDVSTWANGHDNMDHCFVARAAQGFYAGGLAHTGDDQFRWTVPAGQTWRGLSFVVWCTDGQYGYRTQTTSTLTNGTTNGLGTTKAVCNGVDNDGQSEVLGVDIYARGPNATTGTAPPLGLANGTTYNCTDPVCPYTDAVMIGHWVPDFGGFDPDDSRTCQEKYDAGDWLQLAADPVCWCPVYRPVAGFADNELTLAWHMEGPRLTYRQAAAYSYMAGFRGTALDDAVATERAESGLDALAIGDNGTSIDVGIWQINDVFHPEVPLLDSLWPQAASEHAWDIYTAATNSFSPWYGFDNRGPFLNSAAAAADLVEGSGGESEGHSYRRVRDGAIVDEQATIEITDQTGTVVIFPETPAEDLETSTDGLYGWVEVPLAELELEAFGYVEVVINAPAPSEPGYERCGLHVLVSPDPDVRPGAPDSTQPRPQPGDTVTTDPSDLGPGDGECSGWNPLCWFVPSGDTQDRWSDFAADASNRLPWALATVPREWLAEPMDANECFGAPACQGVATTIDLPIPSPGGATTTVPILAGLDGNGYAPWGPGTGDPDRPNLSSYWEGLRTLTGALLWGTLLFSLAWWAWKKFAPGGGS